MPELPAARRRRFVEEYALPEYDAAQLTQSRATADYFERTVRAGAAAKLASNWIMGELARKMKELHAEAAAPPIEAERLAGLIALVGQGAISQSIAKEVFEKMIASNARAEEIVARDGLAQIDDESKIAALVGEVLATNAGAVAQYRSGKTATFGFLVGQVMKAAKGKANPTRVQDFLRKAIDDRS
jgi:aspartyl-tRNA(Asn)/glutamyl-tRNA(Gln) amidotransferase subunit B